MKRNSFRAAGWALLPRFLQNPVRRAMLDNLDLVELVLRTRYAPAEFKSSQFDWDLDAELGRARRAVWKARSLSCREYQELVRTIFESARDYHAATIFDYAETKTLPFSVKGVQQPKGTWRYFTVYVEEAWAGLIPLRVELVRFGSETAADAVENLMKQMRRADAESDRALATLLLTRRIAEFGHPIPPQPDITIELGSLGSRIVPWKHDDELVPCKIALGGLLTPEVLAAAQTRLAMATDLRATYSVSTPSAGLHNFPTEPGAAEAARAVLGRMVVHPLYRSLQRLVDDADPHRLGQKESFFPPLGTQVWTAPNDVPYQAYIYELRRCKVGFIRIADFIHESGADAERDAFAALVSKMQADTDALVIDQFNNPGGSLFHVYALASMLSEKPLIVPRHKVTLDRHEVVNFAQLHSDMLKIQTAAEAEEYRQNHAEELGGYPFTLREVDEFRGYAKFVMDVFNNARPGSVQVLTPEAALMGVGTLAPAAPVVYSKPLFVLVNELAFSGGDFFPAILQDSKRATIIGVGTGGAGGYVMEMSYFNPFGISGFSITASLAIRANGDVLENKGVSPDVPLELSVNDLQHGYTDLIDNVNKTVSQRLGGC